MIINPLSFVTLLVLLTTCKISLGENLRTSYTKSCGVNLELCSDDNDCCSGMICYNEVKSLPSRCRIDTTKKDTTVKEKEESEMELNDSSMRLKLLKYTKAQCLENLEACTDDSECCDDMTCDRSTTSLGSLCRHTVQSYALRKSEQICKKNLDTCSSDNDCCQDLSCDISVPSLGYRCHGNSVKAMSSSITNKENQNNPSPLSNTIEIENKCFEHLSTCQTDAECCDEMLCDSSISSLGNRCRLPFAKLAYSTSVTTKKECFQPFDKCFVDDDCCGNTVKCMQTPDGKEKRCHNPSTSWNNNNIQISNTSPQQKTTTTNNNVGGQCLSWRQDCTSNQNECCEGLTCSSFNKSDMAMQCHFVSYEVKIKY